jgi:hypothetical protein
VALIEYFLNFEDVSKALDIVQVVFSTMEKMVHRTPNAWGDDVFALAPRPAETIQELNKRFRENNVGYQYWQGEIIKQETQFTHSEIVSPALQVLQQSYLAGANQEFLSAHDHFRRGRFKECRRIRPRAVGISPHSIVTNGRQILVGQIVAGIIRREVNNKCPCYCGAMARAVLNRNRTDGSFGT